MRLTWNELKILCESSWDDEIHQSKLFDSEKPEYKFQIFHRKSVYKVDNQDHTIKVISTTNDKNPIYRLEFKSSDLKKIFDKNKIDDFLRINFKDNKGYFKDSEGNITTVLSKTETKEINWALVDIYK